MLDVVSFINKTETLHPNFSRRMFYANMDDISWYSRPAPRRFPLLVVEQIVEGLPIYTSKHTIQYWERGHYNGKQDHEK